MMNKQIRRLLSDHPENDVYIFVHEVDTSSFLQEMKHGLEKTLEYGSLTPEGAKDLEEMSDMFWEKIEEGTPYRTLLQLVGEYFDDKYVKDEISLEEYLGYEPYPQQYLRLVNQVEGSYKGTLYHLAKTRYQQAVLN
ncbi:MAG: hypothetical protein AAF655_21370 [Bacteroidota bacterium]